MIDKVKLFYRRPLTNTQAVGLLIASAAVSGVIVWGLLWLIWILI